MTCVMGGRRVHKYERINDFSKYVGEGNTKNDLTLGK